MCFFKGVWADCARILVRLQAFTRKFCIFFIYMYMHTNDRFISIKIIIILIHDVLCIM